MFRSRDVAFKSRMALRHFSVEVPQTPVKKLFIANRGEIACRIIKTCRKMGIKTVAAWADPDKSALHVQLADESIRIGPAQASASYINAEKLISAAQRTGCDALHPGYGFLSEDASFAAKCIQSGLNFIGPSPHAMAVMGQKDNAKIAMQEANVPVIPGYHGKGQDKSQFLETARRVGYPVIIKAAFGGGGKGMRIARSEEELPAALDAAANEAKTSFGDSLCLLEKLVERSRHLEVQVFGDKHGNAVHLLERDCSTQRRHQKLLEESPGCFLDPAARAKMLDAAVRAAKAVKYVGAGTVEFLVDPKTNEFYFLEMNTRLQVEHTVTEMITGLDLVEWQLLVAGGKPIPVSQEEIVRRSQGHYAVEARICAEKADRTGFAPSSGLLNDLTLPKENSNLRIDSGVRPKDSILPFYDSMIAKIITHGSSREEARARLDDALSNVFISGVASNVTFLRSVLNDPVYKEGKMTTDYISKQQDHLLSWCEQHIDEAYAVAAACVHHRHKCLLTSRSIWGSVGSDYDNLVCGNKVFRVTEHGETLQVTFDSHNVNVKGLDSASQASQKVEINGKKHNVTIRWDLNKQVVDVWIDGKHFAIPFDSRMKAYT